MGFKEIEDDDLNELLEDAMEAEKFLDSPTSKIVQKLSQKTVDKYISKFVFEKPPNDLQAFFMWAMEIRSVIRKHKFGIFEEIKALKEVGEDAYNERQFRKPQSENEESG